MNFQLMNWKRPLLYALFIIYQATAFVFTIMVDGHLDLLGLLKYIKYFKYVSFFGVVLIVVDVLWYLRERNAREFETEVWRKEKNMLRSRIDSKEIPKAQAAEKI